MPDEAQNPSINPEEMVPETSEEWEKFLAAVDSVYGTQAETPSASPVPLEPHREQVRKMPAQKKKKSVLIPVLSLLLCLVLIAGGAFWFLFLRDPAASARLPEGITVSGVSIGGMKRSQAAKTLRGTIETALTQNDMVVSLSGETLRFTPQDSGIALDVDALLEDAMSATGDLELAPYLSVNEAAIRKVLDDYAETLSGIYTPAGSALEGEMPALDEEHFDSAAPCPTLVLKTGTAGFTLDTEALYQQILDGYTSGVLAVSSEVIEQTPDALDLEAVRGQFAVEASDAVLDRSTGTVTPAAYGLDFDRKEAQKLLKNAKPGEEIRLNMEYVIPDVVGQEVYFQDVLGFAQTPHNDNEKRNTNLRLACAALNGVVLQPGEIISYNATLGQRTEEKGFQPAPAYSGTDLVDSVGGGVCQVSSTLYLSSLFAELEITDRVCHGYPAAYMPIGLDATVSWPGPDLKVCNNQEFPVRIMAEEADGFVRIWILGTDTRDHYVRVGFGSSNDGYARSSINRYDKATNELISKEPYHWSSYFGSITSVLGEIGPEQIYKFGMCRDQEIGSPAPETVEASRRNAAPNEHADEVPQ